MPVYRVESAKSGRAVCANTTCKKQGLKIEKGSLRQGTWVEIMGNGSWKWRHWGCVTPAIWENWKTETNGDTEMIDGYEELEADQQAKVLRAMQQGHVDDEDWVGDVEKNRPGEKGFFLTNKEKKAKGEDADDEDDDNDAGEEEDEKPKKASKSKKASKAAPDTTKSPPAKGKKGKRAADDEADEPPAAKRGRPAKKPAAEEEPASKPARKAGRPKKTPDAAEEAREEEAAPPKSRGRPKKQVAAEPAAASKGSEKSNGAAKSKGRKAKA